MPRPLLLSTIVFLLAPIAASAGNHSLRFHGFGGGRVDRVVIEDPLARQAARAGSGAFDFTLELWVRGDASDNLAPRIASGPGEDWIQGAVLFDAGRRELPAEAWGVSFGAGRVAFGVTNGALESATISGKTIVLDGTWHHVAAQRRASDGELSLWVDGTLDASGPGPLPVLASDAPPCDEEPCPGQELVIGAAKAVGPSQLAAFDGWIDEVRFSTSLRYSEEFARPSAPFARDEDTLALLRFDEGAGEKIGAGGLAVGTRRFGGHPLPGPRWSRETPFGRTAGVSFSGLPEGARLEAYSDPGSGQTLIFARFPDPRAGEVRLTIHDDAGRLRDELAGTMEAGSVLFVWSGADEDGTPLARGAYTARLENGGSRLAASFVLR